LNHHFRKRIDVLKFLPALAALLISMLLPATSASAEDSPTIEISHHQLIPAELSVKVGERVIFLNRVDMLGRHGGKADDGSFASPQLEKGQKWRHGFEGMASKRSELSPTTSENTRASRA
jgi:plastocyanin